MVFIIIIYYLTSPHLIFFLVTFSLLGAIIDGNSLLLLYESVAIYDKNACVRTTLKVSSHGTAPLHRLFPTTNIVNYYHRILLLICYESPVHQLFPPNYITCWGHTH